VPLGQGQGQGLSNFALGQTGGTETVTLLSNQLPAHNHAFSVPASQGLPTVNSPAGAVLAAGAGAEAAKYALETPDTALAAGQTGLAGNSQPVAIRDPYLALRYCIAVQGIYPPRP
jgi:microcystin-dependent protein